LSGRTGGAEEHNDQPEQSRRDRAAPHGRRAPWDRRAAALRQGRGRACGRRRPVDDTGQHGPGDDRGRQEEPGRDHNYNKFGVDWTDGTRVETDQFTLLGKIAKNTGVKADAAVQSTDASGKAVVDVFATSEADPGELYVAADTGAGIQTTPMLASTTDAGAKSFYSRVAVTGNPANVTVKNIGDAPTSTSQVAVTKASPIVVTAATFDGSTLHVAASSTSGGAPLTVSGYDASVATLSNGTVDIRTGAAPATVTVNDGTNKATATTQIIGGGITPPGEPPVPAGPAVDPVCTVLDPNTGLDVAGLCPVGGPAPTATPTPNVAAVAAPVALGDSVTLDASRSTNATSYEWTYVSGPQVTFTNGTTAKPTVRLTPYAVDKYTSATLPKAAQNAPAVVSVVAVNGTNKSQPFQVSIPIKTDTFGPLTTKYTANKEYRIDGTSTVQGGALVLNPPTAVAVYNTSTGKLVGTAQVDTTGAWSLRPRSPFPATQDLARNITAVSSRGAYTTGLVAAAPN
jgi:hypothetical protein